ncbi:MAG: geranylgeranylglycerol-phosphate geranylgeranyltransferase [Bacteroidetes bacterium]|nr:geranylgeranylglycerol-phosphate geranylgeranyltransferase [Bacteroidota bacterium]
MSKLLNNKFIAFLKLIRIENLIMIALTQYLIRYCVMQKILAANGIALGLNSSFFNILVLSTVLIAAAGYIINDYFDVKTDMINHPDTVVIDKAIKRRWAIILHITFTIVGVLLGVLCALKAGYLRLAIFHFAAATLLWFYSTNFKKQLLIGNIVVSLLSASVTFIPFVYEIGLLQRGNPNFALQHTVAVLSCFKVVFIFSLFAFITSMAREIIKDMEDFKGDKATGGLTMPIYWGIPASKLTSFFLLVITQILLLFVIYNSFKFSRIIFSIQSIYILVALVLPLMILLILLLKAQQPRRFKIASQLLKFIMLLGLGFSMIFYYN